MNIEKYKLSKLRKLPFRNGIGTYNSIAIIPSGIIHDSGFAVMYIIGLNKEQEPIEIACSCDDLCWKMPQTEYDFRTDMYFNNSVIHFWSRKYNFRISESLSSTDVYLIEKTLATK